jgi:hypothetical protein
MERKRPPTVDGSRRLLSFKEIEAEYGLGVKYLHKYKALLPGLVDIAPNGSRASWRCPRWGIERYLSGLRSRTRAQERMDPGGDGAGAGAE